MHILNRLLGDAINDAVSQFELLIAALKDTYTRVPFVGYCPAQGIALPFGYLILSPRLLFEIYLKPA
ncbi:hypothetical protein ANAPC5_00778 [Anaplasma phagocytophilum]|nr:hypothetical protein ANAPC3_00181 [Anaplasma phagocytophilum]SBO31066.1 hypothetical protein ANAPC4_00377 [Anaplasma phagocytophilum]SCV64137.1 hypothetical protein ANAPC5_00778 [Anaplasma phagocytophilum]